MKVAALAVGGVVVTALTAGVGLVPYITVVGMTAVAGGSAVALQFRDNRRPLDSRLILACDTNAEAYEWKYAIEKSINKLEENKQTYLNNCYRDIIAWSNNKLFIVLNIVFIASLLSLCISIIFNK